MMHKHGCLKCMYCQIFIMDEYGYSIGCTNLYVRRQSGDEDGWASCREFNDRDQCQQRMEGEFDFKTSFEEPKPRPYLFADEWTAVYGG